MIILEKRATPNYSIFYKIQSKLGYYELHLWYMDAARSHLSRTTTLNYWDKDVYETTFAAKNSPLPIKLRSSHCASKNINIPKLVSVNEDDIEETINKIMGLATLI